MTKPRIGLTLGDCAGIGPEIVELALKSGRVPDSIEYVLLGRQPNCKPGVPTPETARAAAAALEEAVTLARRGELEGIVTGPVPGANGIFRGALRRKKFRDVFDWRKTHGCVGHGAHSVTQSPARA